MLDSLMTILPWVVAITGPVWASFFCAKVMREAGITAVNDTRSACDNCGHTLGVFDLIPIISFVALRGKCRYCSTRISWKIFAVELLGLVLFSLLAIGSVQFGVKNPALANLIYLVSGYIILCCLLYLSIYDAFTYSIPTQGVQLTLGVTLLINGLMLIGKLTGVINFEISWGNLDNLLAGLGFGLFFQAIIILTKQKGMGIGDVFVAVIIGLSLGWPQVISAFYVLIISAAFVGIIISGYRKKFRGSVLPLVPFMSFGFVVAYIWGLPIFNFLFRIV